MKNTKKRCTKSSKLDENVKPQENDSQNADEKKNNNNVGAIQNNREQNKKKK